MNKGKPYTWYFTANRTQWLYVTVMVLVTTLGAITMVFGNEIYNTWVRIVAGPKMRHQFGFSLERRQMHYRTQPIDVFVITSVEAGGPLAKAGVRVNDVPLGIFHKNDVAFYRDLERSRHERVEVKLINSDEYQQLLKDGNLPMSAVLRKAVIYPETKLIAAQGRFVSGASPVSSSSLSESESSFFRL